MKRVNQTEIKPWDGIEGCLEEEKEAHSLIIRVVLLFFLHMSMVVEALLLLSVALLALSVDGRKVGRYSRVGGQAARDVGQRER